MFLGEIEIGIDDIALNILKGKNNSGRGPSKFSRRTFLGNAVKAGIGAIVLPYIIIKPNKASATPPQVTNDIYEVHPSDSIPTIQSVIEGLNPGDSLVFTPGTYAFPYTNPCISFKPGIEGFNIKYLLDNAELVGSGPEHGNIIQISRGGYMDIVGENLSSLLTNATIGIGISQVPFKGININGINFSNMGDDSNPGYSISYVNKEHQAPLTEAPIKISYCRADGGNKFVRYNEGAGTTENSPFASAKNCTAINLIKWGVDIPAYPVPLFAEDGVHILAWTKETLGDDEVNNDVFENCPAMTDPDLHQYFSSPNRNRYVDVLNPFIGQPADDNMVITAADFYNGHPVMFKNAHLADGSAAGAFPLVATMDSIKYFKEHYLTTPESPNWDPRVDFDKDGTVTLKDYARVAEKFVR